MKRSSTLANWPLRILIHTVGLLPWIEWLIRWRLDELTFNPIQYSVQFFGRAAIHLLVVALTVTPLVTLTSWKVLSRHRRALGLYAFAAFAAHFFTFAVLDYGFDLTEIVRLTTEKPYIIFGSLAGLILLALAVTSFRYWMKRLGKKWGLLHRLVYLAGILTAIHYALAVKGSLSTLQGDIQRPLLIAGLITLLLLLRLPFLRRLIRRKKTA